MNKRDKLKKKQRNRIRSATIASVAVCSMAAAHATVSYQIGNGGLGTFNGSIDGTENFNNALAGGIKITEQGTPVNGLPTSYVTVCTDLEGILYLGQTYTYNAPTSFSTSNPSTGLDPSWGAVNNPTYLAHNSVNAANAAQAIQNAAYIFYNYGTVGGMLTGSSGISGSVDQLEALQLAVWAALYNTSADGSVDGNRFTFNGVDSTVATDVAKYIAGLQGNYDYTGDLFQPNPDSQHGNVPQELLYNVSASPQGGPVPVPETSTIFAGVLMLLPLAVSTIRIVRKKPSF